MKILLCGISEIFLLMFSSRNLMVSWLIFKSFIHWIYFCAWCKFVIKFHFFFMYLSRSPNTICWRGYFYSTLCFFPLCQMLTDHRDLGLFLGSLCWSIALCVCSYASTRLFWLPWPCNIVWCQVLWSLLLCCFVGMQTGAATVENSMEFPQKTKNGTAFWPSNSTAGIIH